MYIESRIWDFNLSSVQFVCLFFDGFPEAVHILWHKLYCFIPYAKKKNNERFMLRLLNISSSFTNCSFNYIFLNIWKFSRPTHTHQELTNIMQVLGSNVLLFRGFVPCIFNLNLRNLQSLWQVLRGKTLIKTIAVSNGPPK